ncbi:hypothetical protein NBRC116584_33270 [Hydrogenophaga sp. 5NK40-0174]
MALDEQVNDHGACQSCNICHGLAMALTPDRIGEPKAEQQYPTDTTSRFFSNDTRHDRKPPIA